MTPLFLVQLVHRSRFVLRRYGHQDPCAGGTSYHNAMGPVIAETDDKPDSPWLCTNPPEKPAPDDSRWPAACSACGRLFTDEDERQVFGYPLYVNDTGEIKIQEEWGPGALWDAVFYHGDAERCGTDGKSFVVRLPNGLEWNIDGPAMNGGKWTRTGDAPKLTVRPSILAGDYHGYLTDGVLVPC